MTTYRRTTIFSTLFLIFACSLAIRAQGPSISEDDKSANQAYVAKDWAAAAQLYEKLVRAAPSNQRYWYRLGASEKSLNHPDKALEAFSKAEIGGAPKYLTRYAIAEVHATQGDSEAAFSALQEALAAGYAQPEQISSDPDFVRLREDSRFAKLVDQANHNAAPCKFSPENRQFDFWLGEWAVTTTQGNAPAGDSRIELTLGECVIVENWTSRNGPYAGKSYNVYNSSAKRWEQFWVDNSAGMIHFYGNIKDGVMDFFTDEMAQPDGTLLKRHLQFFSLGPDKVRQFSQGSTDHGKTWTVEYDFTYTRKKPAR
jgi:tetratricopeptide (TPR) repeat protein